MKKYIITSIAVTAVTLAIPFLAMAATPINNIADVGSFIIGIINNVLVPVIMSAAFIIFVYGIFAAFILNAGDEEKRKKGKAIMMYGLIGFFVMVSVWGLVHILTGSVVLRNGPPTSIGTGTGIHINQ